MHTAMLQDKLKALNTKRAVSALRFLLAFYIGFCLLVAGLNFGVAKNADAHTARQIHALYEFFENELKIILIVLCSFFALFAFPDIKKRKLYKANLLGFIISALVIHAVLPLLSGNREIYYTAMPLPWSTTGLQLMAEDSSFYTRHVPLWGLAGISAAVVFHLIMTIGVFIATILFGRRVQCSTLCLLNGFASEIWAAVFPLVGKKKKADQRILKLLKTARILMFIVSVLLAALWLFYISGIHLIQNMDAAASFEVFKYISLELMAAMLFWVFWTGRGYCYYCPLGSTLSFLAKLGRQRIRTDLKSCISCGRCTQVCPMSIDVASFAKKGEPVYNSLCVGCGHCVDACPVNTLRYETAFMQRVYKKN